MLRTVLAILCLAPLEAFALSCLPWHVEDAFAEADESAAGFVVARGRLDFDPADWPPTDFSQQEATPPETRVPASFDGAILTADGFTKALSGPVTIIVQCAGPWCPQATPGAEYLAFLEDHDTGVRLTMRACGGFAFEAPTEDTLARVEACFAGGDCTPPQR